jgi:hypothetical protein
VHQRDAYLTELQGKLKMDRCKAKTLILSMLYGGNLHGPAAHILQPFAEELKRIGNQLMQIYPKYNDLKTQSKDATGLALLLHDIECWCMQIAREELAEFGCSVLIHDGLMTQQVVPPDAAARCSAAIASVTGFSAGVCKQTYYNT